MTVSTRALLAAAVSLFIVPCARAEIQFPNRPGTTGIENMRRGEQKPSDGKNKEAIADLAKYLSHRLVFAPYGTKQAPIRIPANESLDELMKEAETFFRPGIVNLGPDKIDNYLAYANELGEQMAEELMYVMNETVVKLEKVNAARLLALCGKLPCEKLADVYMKIIREDKYPREIKLFAFQGLRNLLSIPDHRDPAKHFIKDVVKKNAADPKDAGTVVSKIAEIYTLLDQVITQPHYKVTPDEALVIQFLRREAVAAMAKFKVCVIRNHRKEVMGKPIWTLLRVARNDPTIMPGYNFHAQERIEALLGILTMRPIDAAGLPDPKVNLEAIAYLVNETLYEMTDWQAGEKAQMLKDPRAKPLVAWKITGTRLNDAMKQWKDNMARLPANSGKQTVIDLADMATAKMLSKLETEGINAIPEARFFSDWRKAPERKPTVPQVLTDDESTKFGL
jgi:hypothetical protein